MDRGWWTSAAEVWIGVWAFVLSIVATAAGESCGSCRYFCQAPHEIESQLPGMRSLGSGHASVRASDGICRRDDRYLAATSSCADHERYRL